MSRFSIRPAAEQDLEDIWEYIALDDIDAAERVLDRLYAVIGLLAENPGMGRDRADLDEGLRSFPAESHLIFYRVEATSIAIVRVLHGRRDAERQAF